MAPAPGGRRGQVTRPAKGGKLVKTFPRQGGNVVKISAQKGGKEVITDIEPAPHPLPAAEAPVRDGPRRPPRAGPAPLARAEPEPPAARGVPAARPEQVLAPPLRQGEESRRERQRVPDARRDRHRPRRPPARCAQWVFVVETRSRASEAPGA